MEGEDIAAHGAAVDRGMGPLRVPAQRRTLVASAAAVAAGLLFVAAVSVYRDQVCSAAICATLLRPGCSVSGVAFRGSRMGIWNGKLSMVRKMQNHSLQLAKRRSSHARCGAGPSGRKVKSAASSADGDSQRQVLSHEDDTAPSGNEAEAGEGEGRAQEPSESPHPPLI